MATINEIKQQAAAVKNATQVGENTAERVGGALAGLADIAKHQDVELGNKLDKESVVQESGEAEDKVMSQKAVSDKLSDLYLQNFCGTESKNLFDSSRLAFNGSASFIHPNTGKYKFEAPDGCKTSHLIYLRPKQTKLTISSTFRFDNVFGYKFTDATGKLCCLEV